MDSEVLAALICRLCMASFLIFFFIIFLCMKTSRMARISNLCVASRSSIIIRRSLTWITSRQTDNWMRDYQSRYMTRVRWKWFCSANIQKVTLCRPQELTLRKITSYAIISIAFLFFFYVTVGYPYSINILHEVSLLYNGRGGRRRKNSHEARAVITKFVVWFFFFLFFYDL